MRHGRFPFIDAGEEGQGAEAENLLQFVANNRDDGVIGEIPELFSILSGEETAQQGAVAGGTMWKFVVDESCG